MTLIIVQLVTLQRERERASKQGMESRGGVGSLLSLRHELQNTNTHAHILIVVINIIIIIYLEL